MAPPGGGWRPVIEVRRLSTSAGFGPATNVMSSEVASASRLQAPASELPSRK